ncbi:MAG: stage II sporulation protein M [Candidatus Woesearchaeota archaeon]
MLEQLFNIRGIKGSSLNIILLGVIYTFIGTFSAMLIFPNYVTIMSFAFTSMLLIPSISKMIKHEESVVAKERHFSIRVLFKDHKDIMRLYLLLFLGIFLAYCAMGVFSSNMYVEHFFSAQLKVAGLSGQASNIGGDFVGIVFNNLMILAICFVLSLAYGSGSILFIVWNASVWGVVLGYFMRQSAAITGINPVLYFGKIFIPFLPHMMTEAASYIVAAVMGGVIAKAIIREKMWSPKFFHILEDGLLLALFGFMLVIISGLIEVFVFPLFL